MPDMLLQPMPDMHALDFFLRKKTVATGLDAREIAESWTAQAKAQAFFSAKVASADLLEGMRYGIRQILEGRMTKSQSRDRLRDFIETDGESLMRSLGFASSAEAKESGSLRELASCRRLNLIIETNVRMAQSVGEYQSQIGDKDIFPYVQYHSEIDGRTRPSHRALNAKIFKVGSPEYAAVFPPRGYNCRCYWRQLTAGEFAETGLKSQTSVPQDYLDKRALEKDNFEFNPLDGLCGEAPAPKTQWDADLSAAYKKAIDNYPVPPKASAEKAGTALVSDPAVIKTGTVLQTDGNAAAKLLQAGFTVDSASGVNAEFASDILDSVKKHPYKLRDLGRAVLALRKASEGVYDTSKTDRVFVHKIHLPDMDKLMLVYTDLTLKNLLSVQDYELLPYNDDIIKGFAKNA